MRRIESNTVASTLQEEVSVWTSVILVSDCGRVTNNTIELIVQSSGPLGI